jgi:hypothetical protein
LARHVKAQLRDRLWPPPPFNFRVRDPARLERDVDYALQVAVNYMGHLRRARFVLEGANILELGPGGDFGAQLIIASHGAKVTVADRFLAPWDSNYHPQFYRLLRSRWGGPAEALDAVIAANAHVPHAIGQIALSAEQIDGIPAAQFDLILSNAVLEHVQDLTQVAFNLARITRSPGINLHQIDFRDHRDFSQPLEFLLASDREQEKTFRRMHGELGNRLRASEATSCFKAAGFSIDEADPGELVAEDYFRELLPRLRSAHSKYRNWPMEDLRILGALFLLRK